MKDQPSLEKIGTHLQMSKNDAIFDELFSPGSTNFVSAHLKPLHKIFNSISQHSILTHYGSHEFVSDNDA